MSIKRRSEKDENETRDKAKAKHNHIETGEFH